MTDVRRRLASSAIFYRHKHAEARATRQGAAYGSDEYNRAVFDEAWYSGAYFATLQAWIKVFEAISNKRAVK